MITPSPITTESPQADRSQGTASTVVIGISILLLGLVVFVVAISRLVPVICQLTDIALVLSQQS